MRYSGIDTFEIINGKDVGVSFYTQGCNKHCKGCFNSKAWDFDGGEEYNEEVKKFLISLCNRPGIKRFSILGGEPLLERNKDELYSLCLLIKASNPDIKIWLYTGNIFEEVYEEYKDLFNLIDICIDGPFILELRDISLPFRGSSNQRIIDVQKSISEGKTIF